MAAAPHSESVPPAINSPEKTINRVKCVSSTVPDVFSIAPALGVPIRVAMARNMYTEPVPRKSDRTLHRI